MPFAVVFFEEFAAFAGGLEAGKFEVGVYHDADEVFEVDAGFPAEGGAGVGWVGEEEVHFGGAEVAGVNADVVVPVHVEVAKGFVQEFTDGMGFAGADDEVIGAVVLEDFPHGGNVIGGVTPIAAGIEVAEVEEVLFAGADGGEGAGDFAGDEGFAAAGGFVVEEDAVGSKDGVGLAVVAGDPVGVNFGGGVGALGFEGGLFVLGRFSRAEHFGGGSLVEAGFDAAFADGFEDAHGAEAGDVAGVFGKVEADAHVGLGGEVVDFVGADVVDEVNQVAGVGQVAVVEVEFDGFAVVRIAV